MLLLEIHGEDERLVKGVLTSLEAKLAKPKQMLLESFGTAWVLLAPRFGLPRDVLLSTA